MLSFPSNDSGYEKKGRIKGRNDNAEPMQVWHAVVKDKNHDVVLKIFDLDHKNAELLDAVQKEVVVMRGCSHPNIVQFHTSFSVRNASSSIVRNELWLVLEYMDRGSCGHQLRKLREENRGFSELEVAYIICETLKGIEYFHKGAMIHRDIKADRILINSNYDVKITDFRISSGGLDARKMKARTFVGTPCWMAPEVIEQENGYDCKADIWSIGITAMELAKGRTPFEGQKPLKVLKSILRSDPPELTGEFTQAFKDFVKLCLGRNPAERPPAESLLRSDWLAGVQRPKSMTLADIATD
eukprot:CAMPEP_0172190106 /NCGR_PEP_ID=MMETSP1050-20130122/22920_1 /TAXON_ID=233186 /ORGANISM="Cryptomonas curvata, Strain CCAP979/52" /LENGTH=298 /DNA_ID=CAMNT_0012864925 /DNA_START=66 /DNA_END=959 /DNA_ORIENTATION=+